MTSLIQISPPPVSQGDAVDCGVCSVIDTLQTIGVLTGSPVSYDPNAVYSEYQQVYGTTAEDGAIPISVALMLMPQIQISGLFIGLSLNVPQLAQEINASLAAGHPDIISFNMRDGLYNESGPLSQQAGLNTGAAVGWHAAEIVAISGDMLTIEQWGSDYGDGGLFLLSLSSLTLSDIESVISISTPAENAMEAQVQAEIVGSQAHQNHHHIMG